MPRVLLIDPPVTRPGDLSHSDARVSLFPPLGLAYLAGVLEQAMCPVRVVDARAEGFAQGVGQYGSGMLRYGLSDGQIAEIVRDENPDVLGISCIFSNKDWDMRNVARIAKAVKPDLKVVVGGVHPTVLARELLTEEPCIDFVVLGEGEYTFRSLVDALHRGTSYESLDGVGYRQGEHVCVNAKRQFVKNLDDLPFPARHLLKMDLYNHMGSAHSGYRYKPFASIVTSRGCPAKCTFCAIEGLWGRIPRYRSSQNVLAEIEALISHYGIREVHFEDDNLTANKRRAMEMFNGMIKRKMNLAWTAPSGLAVYSLDEELLEKMAESGCYSVSLAIESGDQKVLSELIRKPTKLDRVKPLVDKARSLRLKTKGFFILGFPGETKNTMEKTIEFARNLDLNWSIFFVATPLVGTRLYQTCKEKGWLRNVAADAAYNFHAGNIETDEFDAQYVEHKRREANIDINFRNNPNLRKFSVDEAVRDFLAVLELYPDLWYAHFYLGEAYAKKEDFRLAEVEWNKALDLKPDFGEARLRLNARAVSAGGRLPS